MATDLYGVVHSPTAENFREHLNRIGLIVLGAVFDTQNMRSVNTRWAELLWRLIL